MYHFSWNIFLPARLGGALASNRIKDCLTAFIHNGLFEFKILILISFNMEYRWENSS